MQLDLLAWAPAATIIPFPTYLRTGKIRRTAETILNSTDKAASYHWRRTIDDMTRQMERAGIDDARIEVEVSTFHDCVQAEMTRIARRPCRPGGDAA